MPANNRFQTRCGILRTLATVLLAGMLLALVLPLALELVQLAGGPSAGQPMRQRDVWLQVVRLTPGLCYLAALWAVRRTFGDLAAGRFFQPVVARTLRQVGGAVIAGALLQAFAVSNLVRIIVHGHGGFAWFDPAGITLGVVGAALVLLARVVEQGARMQRELDEMV